MKICSCHSNSQNTGKQRNETTFQRVNVSISTARNRCTVVCSGLLEHEHTSTINTTKSHVWMVNPRQSGCLLHVWMLQLVTIKEDVIHYIDTHQIRPDNFWSVYTTRKRHSGQLGTPNMLELIAVRYRPFANSICVIRGAAIHCCA